MKQRKEKRIMAKKKSQWGATYSEPGWRGHYLDIFLHIVTGSAQKKSKQEEFICTDVNKNYEWNKVRVPNPPWSTSECQLVWLERDAGLWP